MTDRELLELAARAAGLDDAEWSNGEGEMAGCILTARLPGFRCFWNPLTDDGDALRLAVKLGMSFYVDLGNRIIGCEAIAIYYDEAKFGGTCDPYAATRRAITRAAAEIGKALAPAT